MKRLFLFIVALFAVIIVYANDTVTLTVNGQGSTKEIAITNALRSAIEQAFGVFVSANTQILNDSIVKDEIATVASGNIQQYKEISCVNMPNGETVATISATVAIGKLVAYAKSHGSSAEFAGQNFAMNMKMLELNKQNEQKALEHLLYQLSGIAPNVFDWKLELGEPKVEGNSYKIPMQVSAVSNEASDVFYNTLIGTLSSLSLSDNEISQYQQIGMPTYVFEIRSYDNIKKAWRQSYALTNNEAVKVWKFVLRSDYQEFLIKLSYIIRSLSSSFAIREMGQTTQIYEFRDKNLYESLYEESRGSDYCIQRKQGYILNNPTAFNEEPGQGGNIKSTGLAILNIDKFIIKKGKKHSQPITHQNNVYTHNIEIDVTLNKIASIAGFDVVQKTTSLAEFIYTVVSPWNDNGLAVIKKSNIWGIVNKDGTIIMVTRCQCISQTQNGFIVTTYQGEKIVLDSLGKQISK